MTPSNDVRRTLGGFAWVAALAVALLMLAVADAGVRGPYTTWFNESLHGRALEHELVGASLAEARQVLGEPSSEFAYAGQDDGSQTLNYRPVWFLPFGKFQVHARERVVVGLERYDD